MSGASYEGDGPENLRAKLHGWTQENCVSYSATGLGDRKITSANDTPDDSHTPRADTVAMSDQNEYRHELALRDELLRKELEVRQAAFQRELDAREQTHLERTSAILQRLEDRDKVIDAKLDALGDRVRDIDSKVGGFEAKLESTRDSTVNQVRSSNREVLLGMLAIGVATVLGVWGVNSTIISSASGIFSAGRDDQKTQQASEELLKETQEILRQVKAQHLAPTPTPSAKN